MTFAFPLMFDYEKKQYRIPSVLFPPSVRCSVFRKVVPSAWQNGTLVAPSNEQNHRKTDIQG
jgi:hypothetical protein